jgi:hypothetical protein
LRREDRSLRCEPDEIIRRRHINNLLGNANRRDRLGRTRRPTLTASARGGELSARSGRRNGFRIEQRNGRTQSLCQLFVITIREGAPRVSCSIIPAGPSSPRRLAWSGLSARAVRCVDRRQFLIGPAAGGDTRRSQSCPDRWSRRHRQLWAHARTNAGTDQGCREGSRRSSAACQCR